MTAPVHPAAACPRRPQVYQASITRRQIEALRLAANGNTNAAIAARMGVTADTVNGFLHRAYRKLGASDRTQAVAVALRVGVLSLDDIAVPEQAQACTDIA